MYLQSFLFLRTFFSRVLTLLIVIVLSQYHSYAQGNLQFNQVLTFTGYITGSCQVAFQGGSCNVTVSSPIWVVPQNKVCKIEYKSRTDGGAHFQFFLNAVPMVDLFDRVAGYYSSTAVDNAPLWLKANDEIRFEASAATTNYNQSGVTVNRPYIISIIEYNIVP
jgi:hypothetical protein